MITARQKLILRLVVEEYVRTNEPVGSNTIINHPDFPLNISSATVRNEMVELEQHGLIEKTHFSAGGFLRKPATGSTLRKSWRKETKARKTSR